MDAQMLVQDHALLDVFAEMVILAAVTYKAEIVTFVVKRADGMLTVVQWHRGSSPYRAAYRGAIPPNVVAIAHTHPERRYLPSRDDFELARKLSLPVLVLTRRGISVAEPDADAPKWLLDDGRWTVERHYASEATP